MYAQLGLKANPFPRIPIPEYPPPVTYDPQGILKKVLQEARYTIETGMSNTFVIVGPYGSGKTHYMLAAVSELSKLGEGLVVYVPSPGKSILTMQKAFVETLGPTGLSKLVEGGDRVSRLLELLGDEKYGSFVYAWFCGEAVESKYRYRLDLGRGLDDIMGVKLLSELIGRLHRRGIATLFFVDEVESILDLQPYRRELYFSSLRRLIDLTPHSLFITLSVTPAGWDAMLSSTYALARRVSRNVAFIRPLTLEEARELLYTYLSRAGVNSQLFTERAIEELYKASNGVAGELLKLAGLALDATVAKGASYVERDSVLEALSTYGGVEGVPP